jgi:hypothetical protein
MTIVPEVRHLRLHLPLAFPLLDFLALDVHEALLLAQAHEQAPEFGLYFAGKGDIADKTVKKKKVRCNKSSVHDKNT